MTHSRSPLMFSCMAAILCLAPVVLAQTPATPAEPPKGEATLTSLEATATVTAIDQVTRELTLRLDNGREYTFVAGDAVKNLSQVEKGDVVRVTYTEALAYEVKQGGQGTSAATSLAVAGAAPGAEPAGTVSQRTTVMVTIAAIDPAVPSVTFEGPGGNTRTIKVRYPEKLKAVKVGDMVELTYTEAIAIKLEKAPKE